MSTSADCAESIHQKDGSRLAKAAKIKYILKTFSQRPLAGDICLDIGCGSGIITSALAPLFRRTVGVEYAEPTLRMARELGGSLVQFMLADGLHLPFADDSIDIIICAQVYEHVRSPAELFAEINRVLKRGGLVFFSGPNWLYPIELHYFLPFLHWLPRPLAGRYVALFRGPGTRYEPAAPFTFWKLKLLLECFNISDVTLEVLRFNLEQRRGRVAQLLRLVPMLCWKLALPIFPNFNWLLYKPLKPHQRHDYQIVMPQAGVARRADVSAFH